MPGKNALGIEAGRAIKRGWASPYSLGEPVLSEPSNEVGRASTKGPLGEPVLNFHSGLHACFKAAPAWRGAYSACSAHLHSACSALCLLGASSACSALCLLGTST